MVFEKYFTVYIALSHICSVNPTNTQVSVFSNHTGEGTEAQRGQWPTLDSQVADTVLKLLVL